MRYIFELWLWREAIWKGASLCDKISLGTVYVSSVRRLCLFKTGTCLIHMHDRRGLATGGASNASVCLYVCVCVGLSVSLSVHEIAFSKNSVTWWLLAVLFTALANEMWWSIILDLSIGFFLFFGELRPKNRIIHPARTSFVGLWHPAEMGIGHSLNLPRSAYL